jgi:hypothetical protein
MATFPPDEIRLVLLRAPGKQGNVHQATQSVCLVSAVR